MFSKNIRLNIYYGPSCRSSLHISSQFSQYTEMSPLHPTSLKQPWLFSYFMKKTTLHLYKVIYLNLCSYGLYVATVPIISELRYLPIIALCLNLSFPPCTERSGEHLQIYKLNRKIAKKNNLEVDGKLSQFIIFPSLYLCSLMFVGL